MLFHRGEVARDQLGRHGRGAVRQQVGDPDRAGVSVAGLEDLQRGAVVCQSLALGRPGQPATIVVEVEDRFAHHPAVLEGDDPGRAVRLQFGMFQHRRAEPDVDLADVAHRVPHLLRRGVDEDLLVD